MLSSGPSLTTHFNGIIVLMDFQPNIFDRKQACNKWSNLQKLNLRIGNFYQFRVSVFSFLKDAIKPVHHHVGLMRHDTIQLPNGNAEEILTHISMKKMKPSTSGTSGSFCRETSSINKHLVYSQFWNAFLWKPIKILTRLS